MSWQQRSLWRAQDGAAAVETALVMAVLLLLVAGSMEFARALWTNNTMLFAVEEAGRYAMVHSQAPPPACGVQKQAPNCPVPSETPLANCAAWWAQQVLSAHLAPNVGVSVSEDTSSIPSTMTICASYSFNFLVPRLLPYEFLDLTSRVTVPLI